MLVPSRACACFLLLIGCSAPAAGGATSGAPWDGDSPPNSIDDLFANEKVTQALAEYADQRKATNTEACVFGHFTGWEQPTSAVGTWTTTQCFEINSNDGVGVGDACSGKVSYANQTADNRIEQVNTGGVSMGEGAGFILGAVSGPIHWLEIAQWNHATGAGCAQNVVNFLEFDQNTDPSLNMGRWVSCVFTVVLDSAGCVADPWWKESEGYETFAP